MWGRRRIGKAELGRWPEVYQTRNSVLVHAFHMTPWRERVLYWIAGLAVVGMMIWWAFFVLGSVTARKNPFDSVIANFFPWPLYHWIYGLDGAMRDPVRYGLPVAFVAATTWAPIWLWDVVTRFGPWPIAKGTRVTLTPAAITWWRGGIRRRCDRALPHDFVVEPHEKARTSTRTYYTRAMQVVIRGGVGKAQRLVIADIARDENGNRANLLRAALDYADCVVEIIPAKAGPVDNPRRRIGEGTPS